VKVRFLYAHGTAYLINILELGFAIELGGRVVINGQYDSPDGLGTATVAGLNGRTALWDGSPQDDPFPALLDPNRFEVTSIRYPASAYPMSTSIDIGVGMMIDQINAMPPDQPWAVGGYSQGGAVAAQIYDEVRYGSLTSRAATFLGGVCFGSPRRQRDHRGAVGGTWSGAWDVEGSTTGGAGCFPDTGPLARLTNCEDKWVEFTAPGDVVAATGESSFGNLWVETANALLNLGSGGIINFLSNLGEGIADAVEAAVGFAGQVNSFIDAAGQPFQQSGSGHTSYAWVPPEGLTGKTSYQIALEYLESLADDYAVAPIALPPSSAGWSTRLLPPPS